MAWLICAGMLAAIGSARGSTDITYAVSQWLAPERFNGHTALNENEVLDHINDLRMRPARWRAVVDTLIDLWERGQPPRMLQHLLGTEGPRLLYEVRALLDTTAPRMEVGVRNCLRRVAMKHAIDVARNPLGSPHVSSNGRTLTQRVASECPGVSSFAECVDNLSSYASTVVLRLLFDPDVPGRGHRMTLLDPALRTVGIGGAPCSKHPVLGTGYVVVLTFAGE